MNTIIALLMSLSVHAQTADEMKTVLTCTRLQPLLDTGLSLAVSNGGIAGITELRIERFVLAHKSVETFIVQEVLPNPHLLGAPVVYKGNGVRLSVNFTTAPLANGGHYGQLVEKGHPTEELNCKLN